MQKIILEDKYLSDSKRDFFPKKPRKFKKKIVLTGGHAASSAFVIAEEIRRQKEDWEICWIGFKSSIEGESVSTLSSIYFPKHGIKTYELISGRIQRKWTVHTIPSLFKIPIGFIHALFLLIKIKPHLVLSFGGFSAFPVVVMAYFIRIPVIIHEQTSVVGRTNKYSSFFSKKIAISRETSREYFPKNKTVLTGNPIPKDINISKSFSSMHKTPVIMITGGQSGSQIINNAVEAILIKLLNKYKVIHLAGLKDELKFKNIRNSLHPSLKVNYEVYGMVDPKKYNQIFNNSTILVSRAGANTISKIVASKKPAILIPLAISYLDEQKKNALYAQKYAGAVVLSQERLSSETLLKEIESILKNRSIKLLKYKGIKNPDLNASAKVVSLIRENIK